MQDHSPISEPSPNMTNKNQSGLFSMAHHLNMNHRFAKCHFILIPQMIESKNGSACDECPPSSSPCEGDI